MKITCVLTSFNRPKMVRHALKSVQDQTHRDFEILVYDESSIFDIREVVKDFRFPLVRVFHEDVSPRRRAREGRLAIKANRGLVDATGELICFLCDDDYYYPSWFEKAEFFFRKNPEKGICFGKLTYSSDPVNMVFPPAKAPGLFHKGPVTHPMNRIDHSQVMHRNFNAEFLWNESVNAITVPDAHYFDALSKRHCFYPVPDALAVVKRRHPKNLQLTVNEHLLGRVENQRE